LCERTLANGVIGVADPGEGSAWQADPTAATEPEPAKPRRSRLPWWLLGAAIAVVVLTCCAGTVAIGAIIATGRSTTSHSTRLAAAKKECAPSSESATLSDRDRTLTLDGQGAASANGLTDDDLLCFFTFVDLPTKIFAKILQTSPGDGRQTAEWDGYRVTWIYEPEQGLDVVLQRK